MIKTRNEIVEGIVTLVVYQSTKYKKYSTLFENWLMQQTIKKVITKHKIVNYKVGYYIGDYGLASVIVDLETIMPESGNYMCYFLPPDHLDHFVCKQIADYIPYFLPDDLKK